MSKAKCHNCRHASKGFKWCGQTHHVCNEPATAAKVEAGDLHPFDAAPQWCDTCDKHQPKLPRDSSLEGGKNAEREQ